MIFLHNVYGAVWKKKIGETRWSHNQNSCSQRQFIIFNVSNHDLSKYIFFLGHLSRFFLFHELIYFIHSPPFEDLETILLTSFPLHNGTILDELNSFLYVYLLYFQNEHTIYLTVNGIWWNINLKLLPVIICHIKGGSLKIWCSTFPNRVLYV